MLTLIDTSILVPLVKTDHEKHRLVSAQIEQMRALSIPLVIAAQCLYEFYSVATRPVSSNGLQMKPQEANDVVTYLRAYFSMIYTKDKVLLDTWQALVAQYGVSGRPAHDARLVAWMLANGVGRILTLNPKDFVRYQPQIEVLTVDAP